MPDTHQILANMKVKANRLKEIGTGVRVSRVLGERVLVKTVVPHTEIDEVEKRGLVYIPETVKKDYIPMPTTGTVLAIGDTMKCRHCNWVLSDHALDNIRSCQAVKNSHYMPYVAEGDMVMFPRVAGMDFSMNQVDDYRILHVNDILAVLTDTDGSVVEVKGGDIKEGVPEDAV